MHRILISTIVLAIIGTPSAYGVSPAARAPALSEPALSEPAPAQARASAGESSRDEEKLVYGPLLGLVPVFLHNVNTREDRLFILNREGHIVGESSEAIEDFFHCRRSGRRHAMAPEVLSMLAGIAAEYPGHVIEIVSGYRRRGFGVRRSKHFSGRAIDLRVRGVKTHELRDFLWGQRHEAMGLGHYRHENFIHVDHRPKEPKVGWTQRRKNSPYRYNPRWARADRRRGKRAL